MHTRAAGILLHPTSLPGKFGIGTLGKYAQEFIDYLAECGFTLWQTLPLGPTSFGDSPYASSSAFAGNPLLIDLEDLYGAYHFDPKWMEPPETVTAEGDIDFGPLVAWKLPLLKRIAAWFLGTGNDKSGFEDFKRANSEWLDDYALFTTIKEAHDKKALEADVRGIASTWNYFWPEGLKKRGGAAIAQWQAEHADEIEAVKAVQYFFDAQWRRVKDYANQKGIAIIGDMPIFAAGDSADVWAHKDLFQLDEDAKQTACAGVPPDYFSKTGQLWGNPLYRWEAHSADSFSWWKSRIRRALRLADYVRIDHFRGFDTYWRVPAGEKTAIIGKWIQAPGTELLSALQAEFPDLPVIAEDLGDITPEVLALRDKFMLPGMKVMQFAFSAEEAQAHGMRNSFLPHNYTQNCVCYTGTHDNDTLRGWLEENLATEDGRRTVALAAQYLFGLELEADELSEVVADGSLAANFIATALSSTASMCIIPMQDMLNLGTAARMNEPSTTGKNWKWRLRSMDFSGALYSPAELRHLNWLYGRSQV